jgi:hypothetical protein
VRSRRDDTYQLSTSTLSLEFDEPINKGEESIVLSHPHIFAGIDSRAALSYDYASGSNFLAAIALHSETLSLAITTVSGTADTFLVSQLKPPTTSEKSLNLNLLDSKFGEPSPNTAFAAIAFPSLHFEGNDLFPLGVSEYGGGYLRAFYQGLTDHALFPVYDCKHFPECD